jgi:hypothetical protein
MLTQLPIAAYFAINWLPKRTGQALLVLALQAATRIFPIFAIMWFESL